MKIGIDIDGVLAGFIESADLWHNKNYKTNVKTEDHLEFCLSNAWKCSEQEAVARVFKFYDTNEFKETKAVLDAIEVVRALTEDHELHVITARPNKTIKGTLRWLNKHFSDSFHKIHFTNDVFSEDLKKSKQDLCKEHKINIMIEDCLEFAENCAKEGIKVFLFDWPWNQSKNLHPNIIRVKSWKEILKHIKNL